MTKRGREGFKPAFDRDRDEMLGLGDLLVDFHQVGFTHGQPTPAKNSMSANARMPAASPHTANAAAPLRRTAARRVMRFSFGPDRASSSDMIPADFLSRLGM
jgi:hypothetical protein